MHIDIVPNRGGTPTVLLRKSYREDSKTKKQTVANLSELAPEQIEQMRAILRGERLLPARQAIEIVRSLPHGHVLAALGTARRIDLDGLFPRRGPERKRKLALALVIARLLDPAAKLATARMLNATTACHSLGEELGLGAVTARELYTALDWLGREQSFIENTLARRHLRDGALLLYDVTSTYLEGRHCELARYGYSRDHRRDRPQLVIGLLCASDGCPVAVEVFAGNTADPVTLAPQIARIKQRFGLRHVVLVGDRGLITAARIEQTLRPPGLDWITALRAPQIQTLATAEGPLQLSLFDTRDMAEITSPDYPGERLVVCKNPLLAEERTRKREALLVATETALKRIQTRVQREKNPLHGAAAIGQAVGAVLGKSQVGKHFQIEIGQAGFSFNRNETAIAAEAALDGIYVLRTSLTAERAEAATTVRAYKSLARVERAFRSLKRADLELRPVFHWTAPRVRSHVLLCMLAYYLKWHMRRALAPMLFDDHDPAGRRHSAAHRWPRPNRRKPRVAKPCANKPSRPAANHYQCIVSALCLPISPRSHAIPSVWATIGSATPYLSHRRAASGVRSARRDGQSVANRYPRKANRISYLCSKSGKARCRMGPPPRSLVADAHNCIMVWATIRPAEYKFVACWPRLMASSPRIMSCRSPAGRGPPADKYTQPPHLHLTRYASYRCRPYDRWTSKISDLPPLGAVSCETRASARSSFKRPSSASSSSILA